MVILIGGSRVRTREDVRPFAELFLSPETAVALFDVRGNGESTGSFEAPNTANSAVQIPRFGKDVAGIAGYLKATGFARVVAVGSSMGAWVAVAAAAKSHDLDRIVGLVGGAVSVAASDAYDHAISAGETVESATQRARQRAGDLGYDPEADFSLLSQPGMWIFAELDRSNPTALDVERLEAHQAAGKAIDWLIIENTDHNLIDVDTGEFNGSWLPPVRAFIRGGKG
ncbi:MAG: alpha/beta fold hydrolase [Myxococcota bacterium]